MEIACAAMFMDSPHISMFLPPTVSCQLQVAAQCHWDVVSKSFMISVSLSLSGFTNAHLAEFQRELNSAVLKDMRSNKDNIAVTVLAVDITRKESK